MENNYVNSVSDLAVTESSACAQQPAAEYVGDCPECGNLLHYIKNEKAVECPYCGQVADVKDIRALSPVKKESCAAVPASPASFAMEIDSPDSALIYVETFFKDYNWEAYKQSPVIEISEIDTVVEKHRVKYGANPISWILDFESKILPFTKKLEGLEELEEIFVSQYNGLNSTSLMPKYHLYERITAKIKENAEKFFTELQKDIEYAERLEADAETVTAMKHRFNSAVELYNDNVFDFDSFKEIPAVMEAVELRNNIVSDRLDVEGIDAKATYEKAVKLYNASKNKRNALRLFEVVRDYADSIEYINKINTFFNFDSKLVKLGDRHFLVKQIAPPVFNVRKPEDVAEAPEAAEKAENTENTENNQTPVEETPKIPIREAKPTLSLYEVIGGKAYEPAVISGISYILSFYGNRLFYIKRDRSLCSYDIFTHEETELDRGNVGDYRKEPPFWNKDRTAFYVRKKLSAFKSRKRGCFKAFFSIFKRKKPSFTDTKNNFSLLKIDRQNNTATVEIDRFVDVTEFYNDRMFYIAYNATGNISGRGLSMTPAYMVLDMKTGKKTRVLGDDCHIHNVIGDNVIYTTWDPNEYNQMLYSYNLKTDVTTLIEANIFGYFDTVGDRVYYKVGNKKYAPLFSNNVEGTDRREIMRNAEEIYTVYDGWIYFVRGTRRNTTLFRMSPDGKETVFVCTDISSIVSMNDVYIYYFDGKDTLHVVRNDGKENKVIADDIDHSNLIIDRDYIYFLRHEPVGRDKNSYSLYKMDIDGNNIKKLLFNVNKIQNYDEDSIYVYTCATCKFIATETENELIKSEKTVKHKVSRFFVFDKKTETEKLLLAVGLPSDNSNLEKRGCLRKKVKHTVTYRELSSKIPYRKEGLARVGEVYAQQTTLDIIQ